MVNFRDLLDAQNGEVPTEPRGLFQTLRRAAKFEYLRDVQGDVLDEWFERRNDRDIVMKMNTGSGKTLVGLLSLWSRLKEGNGPGLYLCPDLYLVSQVQKEAEGLGIPCVDFTVGNQIPIEFYNSSAILVTTIHKLINGLSVFGVADEPEYVHVGTLMVDDAHTCINVARRQFTASFSRESEVGSELYAMFSGSLRDQSIGLAADLEANRRNSYLQVPFWIWCEHVNRVATLLSQHQGDDELKFVWPFLRSGVVLENSVCIVSGTQVEISPPLVPIDLIPTIDKCDHRIFMSATLLDDAALIRDFRATPKAVVNPIRPKVSGDIGERLILSPGLVDSSIDLDVILDLVKDIRSKHLLNAVVLVPSRRAAGSWQQQGAILVNNESIGDTVSTLVESNGGFFVFANRYDGIDLPDNACRLLILDGLPSEFSLLKLNEARARSSSPIIRRQQAQKIEQGLGRAVRSQSDYCVVVLTRGNLVSFMNKVENEGFFTPETHVQVALGQELAGRLRQSSGNTYKTILELVDQCLNRDDGWREYHLVRLQQATRSSVSDDQISIAERELEAWQHAMRSQYDLAAAALAELVNDDGSLVKDDQGWYMQLQAGYVFHVDRTGSFEKQLKAHELNTSLLKPPAGVRYRRLVERQTQQAANVREWIRGFARPNALVAEASRILDGLMFGLDHNDFEQSFEELATLLGFDGQRPEREYGKGSDVLWRMSDNHYVVIEAKNQVNLNRERIYKADAEQIANSALWFAQEYQGAPFTPMLIHPATTLAGDAFAPQGCKVMQPVLLQMLVARTRTLVASLSSKQADQWSVEEVAAQINDSKLLPSQIRAECLTPVRDA